MAESNQAFWCHHRDGYSVIAFPRELATAHMAEVRDAAVKVIEHVSAVNAPACLVDLTALDYMGSSLVASIVRIWKVVKEKEGRMVVVTANDRIHEVLKTAGLTRIWPVADTFEAGVHALGLSPEAKVETRERRLLAFVAPIALAGGLAAVAVRMVPQLASVKQPVDWMVYTVLGLAVVASCISMFRESGWRRVLSILVFLASIPLLGVFVWHVQFRPSTVFGPAGAPAQSFAPISAGEKSPEISGSDLNSATAPDQNSPSGSAGFNSADDTPEAVDLDSANSDSAEKTDSQPPAAAASSGVRRSISAGAGSPPAAAGPPSASSTTENESPGRDVVDPADADGTAAPANEEKTEASVSEPAAPDNGSSTGTGTAVEPVE